jgi:medium-chain acyl-[acyl-carrier-protein] hydrolase
MVQHREDQFTVRAFDCRPDGRMKLNALMQYLQESAACHAEQLGVGLADMNDRNCFWVLSNLCLEMIREPRWMEGFTVRTWPSGYTRLLAAREFVGTAQDGSELFRAGSEWMVLDKPSGRPQNLTRLNLNLPQDAPKALSSPLRRLKPAPQYVPACSLRVAFSALDFNQHVNNTEYVRWAFDALHGRLGISFEVHTVHITYLAEAFLGDEIEVLASDQGDGRVTVLERKPVGGENVCLIEVSS